VKTVLKMNKMSNQNNKTMKKLALSLLVVLVPLFAIGQNTAVEKLFEKYGDRDGFTTVTINKGLFKMMAQIDHNDEDLKALSGMESIKILVIDNYEGANGVNFYKEAWSQLKDAKYEELMTVKSNDENVVFLVDQDGEFIKELILLVGSDNDENALIYIKGKIRLKDVAKIGSSFGIEEDGKMNFPGL
jgi:hypothetical protein